MRGTTDWKDTHVVEYHYLLWLEGVAEIGRFPLKDSQNYQKRSTQLVITDAKKSSCVASFCNDLVYFKNIYSWLFNST